jgi:hypothetical protein
MSHLDLLTVHYSKDFEPLSLCRSGEVQGCVIKLLLTACQSFRTGSDTYLSRKIRHVVDVDDAVVHAVHGQLVQGEEDVSIILPNRFKLVCVSRTLRKS